MAISFESLEGRSLFSAGGLGGPLLEKAAALDNPAVQATVALVQADVSAIESARQQIAADSTDTRPALKDVIRAGAELIAADRKAIRDAKGDPTALAAAKSKLESDRQQVRDDIAVAREAFKSDTTAGRTSLAEAMTSLREHLKQLRTDLRSASVIAPTAPPVSQARPTPEPPTTSASELPTQASVPPAEVEPEPLAPPAAHEPPPSPPPTTTAPTLPTPPPLVVEASRPPTPSAPPPPDAGSDSPTESAIFLTSSDGLTEGTEGMASAPPRNPRLLSDRAIDITEDEISAAFDVIVSTLQAVGTAPVDEDLVHKLLDEVAAAGQDRRLDPNDEAQLFANLNAVMASAGLPTGSSHIRRQVFGVTLTLFMNVDPSVGLQQLPDKSNAN